MKTDTTKAQKALVMRQNGETFNDIGVTLKCSRQYARRLVEQAAALAGVPIPAAHRPVDPLQLRLMEARTAKMEALARLATDRADKMAARVVPRDVVDGVFTELWRTSDELVSVRKCLFLAQEYHTGMCRAVFFRSFVQFYGETRRCGACSDTPIAHVFRI